MLVSDPEIVGEIYGPMNKYIDKFWRPKSSNHILIGESILFDSSNEAWATKRKHLSQAFYKDKLSAMLVMVTELAVAKAQAWQLKS